MSENGVEHIGQDSTFRKIVVGSTGLGLACMFGSMAALKIGGSQGLEFRWHWSIPLWMAVGSAAAAYFWSLVWKAQDHSSPETKSRLTRFSIILIAMGLGAFLYPIRFVLKGYRGEISLGLFVAVLFLGVGAWVAYKIARGFSDADTVAHSASAPVTPEEREE